MNRLTLLDTMFLALETPEMPAHIGSLQIFELPEGKGSAWLHRLMDELRSRPPGSPFNEKLKRRLVGTPELVEDEAFEPDYHLRHTVLPSPGSDDQLRSLVARLHANLIDRDRPLWEFHLIEGLANRRFAFYLKIHHAICDGVTFAKWLEESSSPDPDTGDFRAIWQRPGFRTGTTQRSGLNRLQAPANLLGMSKDIGMGISQLTARLLKARFLEKNRRVALPLSAPSTALTAPAAASRNIAFAEFPLQELKAIGRSVGATLNDVVLAMSDSAIRRYLSEQGQIPGGPLVALVPMNLRAPGSTSEGNEVCSVQVKLGSPDQPHMDRLRTISESMNLSKQLYSDIPTAATQASSFLAAGLGATGAGLKLESVMPPPFNLIISNVPGPREARYFAGARLLSSYPVSGIAPMSALNVTVYSYNQTLYFGLVADRRAMRHLQDLKLCLEEVYLEFQGQLAEAA